MPLLSTRCAQLTCPERGEKTPQFPYKRGLGGGFIILLVLPPIPTAQLLQPSLPVDGSSKVQHPALPLLGSQERERGPGASASTLGILVVPQQGLQGGKLRIKVLGWESRADTHWDAQSCSLLSWWRT